jgi:hypothetical protein
LRWYIALVLNSHLMVKKGSKRGQKGAVLGCFETAVLEVSYNQQVK